MKGTTNFAGEVSYLLLDIPREEQLRQTSNKEIFFPFMVKILTSIIAVINPETIVVTGGLIHRDRLAALASSCREIIPGEHMPKLIVRENMQNDYLYGLFSVTLESLHCKVQLIEKRIFLLAALELLPGRRLFLLLRRVLVLRKGFWGCFCCAWGPALL